MFDQLSSHLKLGGTAENERLRPKRFYAGMKAFFDFGKMEIDHD